MWEPFAAAPLYYTTGGQGMKTTYVKVINTGEVVKVYFRHRDGIAYVGKNGIRLLFFGEYEECEI